MFADINYPSYPLFHKHARKFWNYLPDNHSKMYLMTFDADLYFYWGHQALQQIKSIQEYLLPTKSLVAPHSAKLPTNPKITSQTTNIICTLWTLIPILTSYEVIPLGNRTKSVKKCLLMSINLVAPYSAKMPINPKTVSQTITLRCTWWPLTPTLTLYKVTQLGNREKSVQECFGIPVSL